MLVPLCTRTLNSSSGWITNAVAVRATAPARKGDASMPARNVCLAYVSTLIDWALLHNCM